MHKIGATDSGIDALLDTTSPPPPTKEEAWRTNANSGHLKAPPAQRGPRVLDGYMTEDQLAAEIGRSVRTLARWRALGEGPPVTRIGRQILYRESSARAWLESLEEEVA